MTQEIKNLKNEISSELSSYFIDEKTMKRDINVKLTQLEKIIEKKVIQKERENFIKKKLSKDKKQKEKYEIKDRSLSVMIRTAKRAELEYPNGFTTKQFCDLFKHINGSINPYTLQNVESDYDLNAAIRGFMYETSPSSEQHWFRYGIKKVREQVAPWIFANKNLAIVNDKFGWKDVKSNPEVLSERRKQKGLWVRIVEGSNAYYDWDNVKYGPLPQEEILEIASRNRKIGKRKRLLIIED